MALCPFAVHKLIAPGSNDPRIEPVGIVYHVAVSESSSLFDYFAHRSGGIESHFYIRRDGTIEQYRDTAYEADAQGDGNSFGSPRKGFLSVETEGMGAGEWTPAQIASLQRLTVWASDEHGFPMVKATGPFGHGVGYHCLFSPWNKNAHSCPGPDRVKQFNRVIVPWLNSGDGVSETEGDMQTSDKIARWDPDHDRKGDSLTVGQTLNQARGYAERAYAHAVATQNAVAAIADALDKLAPGIAEAVKKALADSVVSVDVNVNGGDK